MEQQTPADFSPLPLGGAEGLMHPGLRPLSHTRAPSPLWATAPHNSHFWSSWCGHSPSSPTLSLSVARRFPCSLAPVQWVKGGKHTQGYYTYRFLRVGILLHSTFHLPSPIQKGTILIYGRFIGFNNYYLGGILPLSSPLHLLNHCVDVAAAFAFGGCLF